MGFSNAVKHSLKGLRVLIRSDFNVGIVEGSIQSDARLIAALPTIQEAKMAGAHLLLMSHLGQPKASEAFLERFSLQPLVPWLEKRLEMKVQLVKDYLLHPIHIRPNEIILLENVRFNEGEIENDPKLSRKYADLCDLFVMDAFSVAHRQHASTCGILEFVASAQTGNLFDQEIAALNQVMDQPVAPVVFALGGAKLSTKLPLIKRLAPLADAILLGGGIANTFLVAQGLEIGTSLYEPEFLEEAKALLKTAPIVLPHDVMVFDPSQNIPKVKAVQAIEPSERVQDIGPDSIEHFSALLAQAKTILWNGPFGCFEQAGYQKGTQGLVTAIVNNRSAFSVAGGGETLSAIERYGDPNAFSYLSMGGGAFLAYLSGQTLPTLQLLETFIGSSGQVE